MRRRLVTALLAGLVLVACIIGLAYFLQYVGAPPFVGAVVGAILGMLGGSIISEVIR